ncbi:hypothetical protein [Pseudomonas fragi]|uniref:hypothetical protein n=1 Tax=Pseudomonas fragi TaxID=296 RepID=UPI002954EF66|nr:hypothetical protein [Pseudomonas fragi]WOL30538.1 hypothetical protein Q1A94_24860 [Pseudomonas fragi]
MNLDKIRRRDLQLIAYHEAGHLIALTRLGGYGHIRIEDAPEASDVRELRLYCGRVYILAQPTAERAHILVGLAGLVAEELLDEPLADAWELVEFIENGGIAMSETDAAMAQGFTVEDVEETISGRLMAQGILNMQMCHREVRKACLPGHYDYDVECCHYALLASLAKRQEFPTPRINAYVSDKNKLRREVQMSSGGSYEDAKRIITALIYGAPLTASPQGSIAELVGVSGADRLCRLQPLSDLYAELRAARNQVMEAHRQEIERTGRITNAAGRRIPAKGMRPSQLLSHVLTGEESEVLKAAIAYASENIVLLAHDGFVTTEPLDRAELVSRIKNHTGHDLSISEDIFPSAAR